MSFPATRKYALESPGTSWTWKTATDRFPWNPKSWTSCLCNSCSWGWGSSFVHRLSRTCSWVRRWGSWFFGWKSSFRWSRRCSSNWVWSRICKFDTARAQLIPWWARMYRWPKGRWTISCNQDRSWKTVPKTLLRFCWKSPPCFPGFQAVDQRSLLQVSHNFVRWGTWTWCRCRPQWGSFRCP